MPQDPPTPVRTSAAGLFLLALLALAACSQPVVADRREPAAGPVIGYGTVMADVARRFEPLGRAATAGRFELAEYELGEIEEAFSGTLLQAAPPREGHPEVLPGLAGAFAQVTLADLRAGLASRDRQSFDAAFARAATACNGCHRASGHGFIEVPTVPGRSIPATE